MVRGQQREREPMPLLHAAGVVILNEKNEVLLVRQKKLQNGISTNLPGTYGLPSGLKRPSQSLEVNGADVTIEETGIETKPEDLLEIPGTNLKPALIQRTDGNVLEILMHAYLRIGDQDIEPLDETSTTIPQWVSQEELIKLEEEDKLLPNVKKVVEKARRFKKQLNSSAPISVNWIYRSDSPVSAYDSSGIHPLSEVPDVKESGMRAVLDRREEIVIANFVPLDSEKDIYSYSVEKPDAATLDHIKNNITPSRQRAPSASMLMVDNGSKANTENSDIPPLEAADWRITSKCNLACDFCYGPVPKRDPKEAVPLILGRLLESPVKKVTFCGGDPLIVVKDTVDSAIALQQDQRPRTVIVNVNGELVRKRLIPELDSRGIPPPFKIMGFSIEGPDAETHKAMRTGRGRVANFEETIEGYRWAQTQTDMGLKVATVFSSVNKRRIKDMAHFVRDELQPDIWRGYQFADRGDYNVGAARHTLERAEYNDLVAMAKDEAYPVPLIDSNDKLNAGCFIIEPDGTVLGADLHGYTQVADLANLPLLAVWEQQNHQAYTGAVDKNKGWIDVYDAHRASRNLPIVS